MRQTSEYPYGLSIIVVTKPPLHKRLWAVRQPKFFPLCIESQDGDARSDVTVGAFNASAFVSRRTRREAVLLFKKGG